MRKFDESRIITDETGYNYVRVTPEEVRRWGGYNICNGCNGQFLNEDMNLFFGCSDTYCDKCFNDMKKRWKTYSKEDIDYDMKLQNEMSLDWYKYHLDDEYRLEVLKKNDIDAYNAHLFNILLSDMDGEDDDN